MNQVCTAMAPSFLDCRTCRARRYVGSYQRTVVSEVAGTTRDAVSVRTAFDGWPVELIDTAGLRSAEGLEAEGIGRAKQALEDADLGVWVIDASVSDPVYPTITNGVVGGLL